MVLGADCDLQMGNFRKLTSKRCTANVGYIGPGQPTQMTHQADEGLKERGFSAREETARESFL